MESELKSYGSFKEIILIPELPMEDLAGKRITQVNIEVFHGTGMATGAIDIGFKFVNELGDISDIGGFTIKDNKLALLGRSPIQESESTRGGKLALLFNNFFARNPEQLEKLKQELQITE